MTFGTVESGRREVGVSSLTFLCELMFEVWGQIPPKKAWHHDDPTMVEYQFGGGESDSGVKRAKNLARLGDICNYLV